MEFPSLFLLIGAVVVIGGDDAFGESSIGCLFSENVCDNNEWCYDDNVFGRCLSEPIDETKLYHYTLERDILEKLEHEMTRLFQEGYRWSHAYTQCILQHLLYTYRFGLEYNPSLCKDVAGLEHDLDFISTDPQDLAVIRFNPTYMSRDSDFADEWFLPPVHHDSPRGHNYFRNDKKYPSESAHIRKKKVKNFSNKQRQLSNEEYYAILLHLLKSDLMNTNNIKERTNDDLTKELPSYQLYNYDFRDDSYENPEHVSPNDVIKVHPVLPGEESSDLVSPDQITGDEFAKPENVEEEPFLDDESLENDFYNEKTFRDGGFKRLHRYDVKKPGPNFMNNLDDFDSTEAVVNEQLHQVYLYKLLEQIKQKQNESGEDQEFTAEGMVKSDTNEESESPNKASELRTNEINKEKETVLLDTSKRMQEEKVPENLTLKTNNYAVQKPLIHSTDATSEKPTNYDIVDASYAYINVDKDFSNLNEGVEFIRALEKLLQLPDGVFSNIRVEKNQVTFKVNSNLEELNASSVASKAESLTTELKEMTGRTLMSAGIGDQVKVSLLSLETDKKLFIVTFVVCGCIAGILIAVAVIYVVRRHARTKEKLQSLSQPETEPSHDYQDLCRQRMANKNNEKPEPIHAAQRITSLSRESETSVRSPSSRSSTSSWSEEPVVSNMDISTGHMVLSYMEDHLKNKDRLDQEWIALCAYEAEPCSIIAATQSNNFKKNRYPDVLPYDHSRVVLNDLTNIAGSDYINASTITDHDPRNPAYIATQGPLPQTAADFWQMVWEQGSVVIVMLTRLVENGFAMCHRYWPEEGSELYHIYEVHLVSEHIWCDDYLVRSFYLKNLKTGESRTLTQFHFLSWPENSVPSSVKALLDFRRKMNKTYRGRSCPIVVHCSDGSGRTGTYCLIDMVLNRMAKGAKEIDIAATLEHIRDQRPHMVKTKSQFEFALTAVAEEVHAILKALPQ